MARLSAAAAAASKLSAIPQTDSRLGTLQLGRMYLLYTVLLSLALLLSLPWWLLQMLRLGKYRAGLAERFGRVPQRLHREEAPLAWVHAVSVGEVLAVSRLVEEMRAGGLRVVVSTTTQTGQRLARERFDAESVFYFPMDLPFAIRPYLRRLHPALVVLAETEFWPMFLRMAARSGARVAVVNARISDRSLPRYRRFRRLLAAVLANVDLFLAQSEEDGRRLLEIGAPAGACASAAISSLMFLPPCQRPSSPACAQHCAKPMPGRSSSPAARSKARS